MIRKFSRRSGYQSLKKVLSISLTLLLALQVFNPAVLAINNVLAAPAEKVNVCHWSDEDSKYVAITISENGLNGHGDHLNDFLPGELGEGVIFNDAWCADNAPEVPPTEPEMGSLTVTKVVSGGTKQVSDFPLFVNGMPITSGVASTSIAVGSYTVTETGDPDYIASFSGDCNANGVVNIEDDENASCTITNTFDGTVGGGGESDTFKVKILKYVDGSQATANSANNASFSFDASWNWTDNSGTHNSSGNFQIDQNGGIGGAPAYQAWTSDMTAPADYAVHEITTSENPNSNVLPADAQCVEGKFRLQGYKTGTTLSAAQNASLTTVSPSFNDINSERYVIVYNEKCTDNNPPPTGTTTETFKVKISKYLDGVHATASSSNSYEFPFVTTYNWTDGSGTHAGTDPFTIGPVGSNGGASYEAWTIDLTGPADYALHEVTNDQNAESDVLPVGAQCQEGMYRLVGYRTGTTLANAQAASLSTSSPSFMDIGSERYVLVYNETCPDNNPGTTTPFKVTILKYLDGVQATASTSNNYSFPFQATWDWTDTGGNHSGTGAYTIGSAGWGGSPAYQAWTADMTGPADYATHEITSNIDSSSHVLPVGAQCQEGMYRLVGYRTGTTLANAQAASLSTTSPSFTDINSARYIIAYNETCPNDIGTTTGTILVKKVVINDNGGTGTTSDFSFQLNGGTSTAFEIDGENSLTVATGTHSITEVASSTYSTSYNNCSNINVSAGETEICTITNNDIGTTTATGTIVVNKIVINNNSGTSTASSFPLFVGSTSVVMGATTTLPLGTYTVSETYNPNLYAQSFSGDCNSSGVVTLSGTTTKVCTITNHDIPQICPVTEGMIVSDTNTMVGTSSAAVLSFVHPAWTADVDGASTTANWIWSTNPVATTTATTTATFTRTFTVNGSSTAATLNIATDNTYRVWINGNFVGESTDGNNFQLATQDSWNVSNFLVDGSNTLTIEVTNLPTPDVTDPQSNPAGLLYSLSWSANDCPVVIAGGGNNNGQGGDNAGVDTSSNNDNDNDNNKSHHRTIVRGNNNDNENDNVTGTVLGISTINPDTPVGRVLGIAQTIPGLPNTGNGEVDRTRTSSLAVIVISLLVLSGAYLLQYRMLKKR